MHWQDVWIQKWGFGYENRRQGKEAFWKSNPRGKGKYQKPAPYISSEERKDLIGNKKCFFCKDTGHIFLDCPKRKSKDKDAEKSKNKDADKSGKKVT